MFKISWLFKASVLLAGLMSVALSWAAPPILVLNSLSASVSVIDPVTYAEIKRIPVGKEPHHIYMTPDSKSALVANATGNTITFIDPKTGDIQRTLTDMVDPYHLRFSPDMKSFKSCRYLQVASKGQRV